MDPIDDELKKGLANGPLTRHGFSENLKKRIEQRVEERNERSPKWMLGFSGISTVLIAAAILLTVQWQQPTVNEINDSHTEVSSMSKQEEAYTTAAQQAVQIRSAVLIGLREDHPALSNSSPYSTYRTLLLAAEQGELRTVAEGEGILMPYKSDFIRITPQTQKSNNEESRTLHAVLAAGGAQNPQQEVSPPVKPLKNAEKLLFAGNRYLALSQSIRHQEQGEMNLAEYVWVKELDDLSPPDQSQDKGVLMPTRDPHLSLRKLYGESIQPSLKAKQATAPRDPGSRAAMTAPMVEQADENGESWTISRRQGAWVAQMASYREQPVKGAYRFQLVDVPLKLPESVVAYDQLAVGWEEIKKLRPNATDAFSSPNRELVGVLSASDIAVYPYKDKLIAAPLLTEKLAPNESVVMIQWATQEPYIEQWKQKGRLLLGN
jgi:hypothetical protein